MTGIRTHIVLAKYWRQPVVIRSGKHKHGERRNVCKININTTSYCLILNSLIQISQGMKDVPFNPVVFIHNIGFHNKPTLNNTEVAASYIWLPWLKHIAPVLSTVFFRDVRNLESKLVTNGTDLHVTSAHWRAGVRWSPFAMQNGFCSWRKHFLSLCEWHNTFKWCH